MYVNVCACIRVRTYLCMAIVTYIHRYVYTNIRPHNICSYSYISTYVPLQYICALHMYVHR